MSSVEERIKSLKDKVCRNCGKDIPMTVRSLKYCGDKCRLEFYKKK